MGIDSAGMGGSGNVSRASLTAMSCIMLHTRSLVQTAMNALRPERT